MSDDLHSFVLALSGPTCNPFELARVVTAARSILEWNEIERLQPAIADYAKRLCSQDAFVRRVMEGLYSDDAVTGGTIAQWVREATTPPQEKKFVDAIMVVKSEMERMLSAPPAREVPCRPEPITPPDDSNLGWLAVLGCEAERKIYGGFQ